MLRLFIYFIYFLFVLILIIFSKKTLNLQHDNLIIPKISSNLYAKNINETLNQLETDPKEDGERSRYLLKKKREFSLKTLLKKILRILSDNISDSENGFDNVTELIIKEYSTSNSKKEIDNLKLRDKENSTNNSDININYLSFQNIENEKMEME